MLAHIRLIKCRYLIFDELPAPPPPAQYCIKTSHGDLRAKQQHFMQSSVQPQLTYPPPPQRRNQLPNMKECLKLKSRVKPVTGMPGVKSHCKNGKFATSYSHLSFNSILRTEEHKVAI